VCAALSLVASSSRVLSAQRVLGVGEDATVLPRGAFRIAAQGAWSTYNELYGPGGKLEGLGAPFTSDSLGAAQLEILRPLQTNLRTLAQQPAANVTLGPSRMDFSARIARSSIGFDLGLTSRIMLSARLPYEHTISEVVFDVNPRNTPDNAANIALNPALTTATGAAAKNALLVDSLFQAANTLNARLGGCAANPADVVCNDRAQVLALIESTRVFATGIARTYGTGADTTPGAVFVPLAGSTIQSAIAARVTALNASIKTYIPQLGTWSAPTPAQVPFSAGQTNALISDVYGVAPLGLVDRSHIGDIEVGAKVLILDTFGSNAAARSAGRRRGFRLAIGGLARLGTGQVDRPNELVDVGTGDGQTDLEANGALDIVLGHRWWGSVVGRFGVQMQDEQLIRIPEVARSPFVPAFREQTVTRDLGDYLEIEATPRFVYNEYLSASLQWSYRRKAEDTYSGQFTVEVPDEDPISLDASILGIGTEQSEQRVGAGATFSTLRAYDRGRARLPVEIQLFHYQTVSGEGYVPKRFSTQVQIRYYTRMFGPPLRPRATPAPTPAR
jgi:hypothetical protein